jgi:hypothetical protein
MRRLVQTTAAAVVLALPLVLPAGAGARTNWVCDPPGENTPPVIFVSAADRALDGITQANSKAGAVFNRQFGEVCHVESVGSG